MQLNLPGNKNLTKRLEEKKNREKQNHGLPRIVFIQDFHKAKELAVNEDFLGRFGDSTYVAQVRGHDNQATGVAMTQGPIWKHLRRFSLATLKAKTYFVGNRFADPRQCCQIFLGKTCLNWKQYTQMTTKFSTNGHKISQVAVKYS
jgi:hypothetical protein